MGNAKTRRRERRAEKQAQWKAANAGAGAGAMATPHFDYNASVVSKGLANLSLELRKPVTFDIITADTLEQAIERAGTKHGNKGWEAALSAIEMANLYKSLRGTGHHHHHHGSSIEIYEGKLTAEGLRFGIVASRFNHTLVDRLVEGAIDCIVRHGGREEDITLVRVPGSWEIPVAADELARKEDIDAVIAFGDLIRG
uniref:Antitermination protein N,6,7-dimethyl-8-ribityllumazine synthase,6,7-dimethyl-8-ribityllumazine synthase n=1 Tax=Lambdavirus lambda TaxID=10710 RepID=UPI001BDDCA29|nr:Chain 0A, Antitermination protein N,6,7-dimethyl-8-ribityllumazine synthase,6,7-dimethyl-8-ribityllumazine synthase [synthetic construct]7A4I_0B Chain 0B, Antitermination protein N,6,7-dimethyl-8-ribityllumazine synthase,6,7-dimethyl-8-ribityllumazine synthase [synthetic construct]7A4I_0C Chain 0C, Antitermination protein N,6,7-dimethyl-8-ribityllumazine synthase,6,7-dimethyl-8-ribityllumazine synthase [synthetic construct]7A4I_0D Chain 0D, Antitermination protein N,6,7-dimethyl-8-ribitylluma